MKVSVEISMYPLDREYGTPILKFIERLRTHEGLELRPNTMSTQVFGEYDTVTAAVTQEMRTSFEEGDTVVMVMKVVNQDLKP